MELCPFSWPVVQMLEDLNPRYGSGLYARVEKPCLAISSPVLFIWWYFSLKIFSLININVQILVHWTVIYGNGTNLLKLSSSPVENLPPFKLEMQFLTVTYKGHCSSTVLSIFVLIYLPLNIFKYRWWHLVWLCDIYNKLLFV